MYVFIADSVMILHLLFILFLVFGGLLVLRWKAIVWCHVPALVWGSATEFFGLICPLTPLENYFRQHGNTEGYAGTFIDQYLTPLIYPPGLDAHMQWALGAMLLGFNTLVYYLVWRRYRSASRMHEDNS